MTLDRNRYMTRAEALQALIERWKPEPARETVVLAQSQGRICAGDVFSRNCLPVCRSSQVDGIAVRFADFESGMPRTESWIKDRDYVVADTGDDFDDRFDTVIRVEDLTYDHAGRLHISISEPLQKGQFVNPRGALLRPGELLVRAGATIRPLHLGLLAAGGVREVQVVKKPLVAFIPSGNELVPPGVEPQRGQNVESNSIMVAGLLQEWGAETLVYPVVKDRLPDLQSSLDDALQKADIVLLNGGSSKGREDYVAKLLQERSSFFQHGVASVPGIPVAVALVEGKPVINLPGPPFAAFCAMDWCVRALVYRQLGQTVPQRTIVPAVLQEDVSKPAPFEFYLRLKVFRTKEGYCAQPLTMKTRNARAMADCNALTVLPAGIDSCERGQTVRAELLYGEETIDMVTVDGNINAL
ncbi:MAG TPA: molybdopterin molybdenumtransferase MoeA [Firmicutes bacterium]|jgi:molybdopterin molybdotransferase|nr:molybdopterin molybdotransferase MoeA [Bacillota bacterium]NLL58745.1 molybdopterin molybdotransferase MoeA [Bacillota bacterium]HAA34823.1 molybdopterin molybdenumtransferase MoeA [Bacillota bacterium]